MPKTSTNETLYFLYYYLSVYFFPFLLYFLLSLHLLCFSFLFHSHFPQFNPILFHLFFCPPPLIFFFIISSSISCYILVLTILFLVCSSFPQHLFSLLLPIISVILIFFNYSLLFALTMLLLFFLLYL